MIFFKNIVLLTSFLFLVSFLFLRQGSIRAVVNNIYQNTGISEETINNTIQNAINDSTNVFFKNVSYGGKFPASTFHM